MTSVRVSYTVLTARSSYAASALLTPSITYDDPRPVPYCFWLPRTHHKRSVEVLSMNTVSTCTAQ